MYLDDDQEALMDAVLENNQRKVNALLKKGVDPDFDADYRGSPLTEAIRQGNLAMVKSLVGAGADVNRAINSWENPIDVADRQRNAKIIDYLESLGAQSAQPNRLLRKQQELMDAVDDGDTRKVKALLDKGLDPDFADEDENTPLDVAIRAGSDAIVRALVDAGADVNRVNSSKEAPLDLAKDFGETAIAQYLENEGAITGKTKAKTGSKPGGFSAKKKARGSSIGVRDDDDFWEDDRNYFGAGDDEPRKHNTAKPKVTPKTAATPAVPVKQKPVFREDTLKDIFNAKSWVGKTQEMEELWNDVPKRLHKHFDFAAALAEARRETLKQNAPKQRIALQPHLKPQAPAPESTTAQNDAVPPPPAIPQPPKPQGPNV